ncbi:NUDIX hydrolase domain-like protein [Aspergillus crustosus]
MPKSYLDIVKECDNFPYYSTDPTLYTNSMKSYYAFKVSSCPNTLGHVPGSLVTEFEYPGSPWILNHDAQELILTSQNNSDKSHSEHLTALLDSSLKHISNSSTHPLFTSLQKSWRNESFPITSPSPSGSIICTIERSASAIFGLLTTGVQLLCFVKSTCPSPSSPSTLKLWVGRRSHSKQTYPGMLDCTAAGGLESGLQPLEGIVREAVEEASLPESLVRDSVQCAGALSYYHVKPPLASLDGVGVGLLQPEIEYVYEMELDHGTIPRPGDSEVEEFYLWSVDEVKEALGRGEFKLNSAIVVVDFLIRHGVVTPENERGYLEIVSRLHRRL